MGKFVRRCQNCLSAYVYLERPPQPDTRIICDPCKAAIEANAESAAKLAAEKAPKPRPKKAEGRKWR